MDKSINIEGTGYVYNSQDIVQSWHIILTTIKGSDPLRQKFGSSLYKFIDKPFKKVKGDLIATIKTELEHYETRATIKSIEVERVDEGYKFKIIGKIISSNEDVEFNDIISSLGSNILKPQNSKSSFDQSYDESYE